MPENCLAPQKESRVTCIKMASNENPFGPSPLALKAMHSVLAECNLYPDNDARELRQKLAERHNVAPDQVLVAAGLTSLLDIIARTLLSSGLNAVTSERSFIVYPIVTQASGAQLIQVPMRDHGFDLDAIAAAINRQTRIVFIANPNNPTGALVTAEEVDRFLDKVPEHVTVLLDEAYCDFAEAFAEVRGVHYSHSFDYVRQGRPLVVLRTFSKAHGLAGLRVGYGVGPAELMGHFARMRSTFSISGIGQAAALAALQDDAHRRKGVESNMREAVRLIDGMAELGFHPLSTWANFVYCELGEDAAAAAKRIQAEGVIVRPLGAWGAPQAIRVTIGTPEQNEVFLRVFRKAMERAAVT